MSAETGQSGTLDGRYIYADAPARHSRDPIALTTQVKYMREMGEANGWKPALILVVVDEANLNEAGERVRTALNGDADPERRVESAA
jgi:hypothetical protein